jgi:23S rRNA pseudouridine1911/1915/1917 synthase
MPHASRPHPSATSSAQAGETAELAAFVVTGALAGQRLDRALVTVIPGLSRTRAQTAIAAHRVTVNGRVARPSLLLEAGMRLTYAPEPPAMPPDGPSVVGSSTEQAPLHILYEDDALLVVEKAAGVVVHPAPGHASGTGTLVDALLAHAPGLHGGADAARPGIVHRLDKDTSGLLVVAKNAASHAALARQMKDRAMIKRYLALVEGEMPVPEGVIEAPIGRDPRHRQRMALVGAQSGGREARTRFRVLRTARGRSLLEVTLDTGRTHQIRVHLAAVQHPVVGDPVYGRPQPPAPPRQFLHAAHLEFTHPTTGAWMTFDAPLPDDLAAFLAEWER